jgi:hypothetical protein
MPLPGTAGGGRELQRNNGCGWMVPAGCNATRRMRCTISVRPLNRDDYFFTARWHLNVILILNPVRIRTAAIAVTAGFAWLRFRILFQYVRCTGISQAYLWRV